jgi:hypothetical protein
MKCIDFRSRPPFGDFLKGAMYNGYAEYANSLWNEKSGKALTEKTMEAMLSEMDEAEIEIAVANARPWENVSNECLSDLVKAYPKRFVGLASINNVNPFLCGIDDCIDVVDRFIVNGTLSGLVLEPGMSPDPKGIWNADDKRVYPLYEKCEKEGVMINYTWGNFGSQKFIECYKPEIIFHVAQDFPNLKIVLSHAGWSYIVETLSLAMTQPNIYLSIDDVMIPTMPGYKLYVEAVNNLCPALKGKLIYGSCYPIGPEMKRSIERLKEMGVHDEALPDFLYNNAAKVLGILK